MNIAKFPYYIRKEDKILRNQTRVFFLVYRELRIYITFKNLSSANQEKYQERTAKSRDLWPGFDRNHQYPRESYNCLLLVYVGQSFAI